MEINVSMFQLYGSKQLCSFLRIINIVQERKLSVVFFDRIFIGRASFLFYMTIQLSDRVFIGRVSFLFYVTIQLSDRVFIGRVSFLFYVTIQLSDCIYRDRFQVSISFFFIFTTGDTYFVLSETLIIFYFTSILHLLFSN